MKILVLSALLLSLSVTFAIPAKTGVTGSFSLKPTYGGALIEGRLNLAKSDELVGLWSSLGRARLMKCTPRCTVVKSVPVNGTLLLSADSAYRVVLGGKFKTGQKVGLVMRFKQGTILNFSALVSK